MSTPQSKICVCSGVLLTNDYLHTIWFDDHSAQMDYFAGKVVKTFLAYTYVRKSWSIKVEATMEQARTWSYLYFQNGTGKTYFYFINNIEYINDNTVELFIEMDVMQTYLHEYTLHECFVEREHSATDAPGDNLVEEGLDVGELINIRKTNVQMQNLAIMVMSTIELPVLHKEDAINSMGHLTNGVYNGCKIYAVSTADSAGLGRMLEDLDSWGLSDCILSMWMYPLMLLGLKTSETIFREVVEAKGNASIPDSVPVAFSVGSWRTPRNKKLYTYPYNFLYVTNNAGGSAVYRFEQFNGFSENQNPTFALAGTTSPEASVKMFPVGYKGISLNYDEGISLGDYPTCAWNQDVYKLWLAQNHNQQSLGMLTSALTIGAGIGTAFATGGVGVMAGAGMVYGGASQIASTLAQRADREIQPPQAKGAHSSNVNVVAGHQTFSIYHRAVDEYHLAMIDEYFDLYGYATKRVKVPNRHVRENWTYTKTINCHVSGGLCTEDLRKIQSIYDNGITFWMDGDKIGSYGLTNKPTEEV